MTDYKPHILKVENVDDILNSNSEVVESKYRSMPLFSLGFHQYIHRNNNKLLDSQLKRKFYLVVNQFEHNINDNDKDLETISKKYFGITKDKPEILSRDFYKLWELLMYFDLLKNDKQINTAHLAECPGSFVQAVMFYREKYFDNKNDNHNAISLHCDTKETPEFEKKFLKYYTKNFNVHKTVSEKKSQKSDKDNGDLTNTKTIENFKKMINKSKKKIDLVTADGSINKEDINYIEQNSYSLILGEIITALSIQKKGGNFVLKIFESFTHVTLKYICLLKSLYKDVYICKPLTSRASDSERYIVCLDFKLEQQTKIDSVTLKLTNILEKMNKINGNKYFTNDIFTNYNYNDKFIEQISAFNIKLSNNKFNNINKIVEYKNGGNYFGDKYHQYKREQIAATEWWKKHFLPENKSDLEKVVKKTRSVAFS